jgi:tetratricopeptide (TPR) repeat protein
VLHGRATELTILDEVIASARAGRGRAACFTGEAGIGKSSLLAAARERAGDLVVCAGAAWESGGAPPYWPWQSVLRDAHARFGDRVPELVSLAGHDSPDLAAARFALLDSVVRVLVELAHEQPLLVLLDDLHAADVPTLDLLVLAVQELPRASIALVAAWREGELAVRADAAQRLARAARHATVQPLRRLTADEVTRWIGEAGAAVHASTEGNPLFVEETVRARRAATPPRAIASALADHLALVADSTRELLAIGSVLGRELEPGLLAALAGQSDDAIAAALREAERVGVAERRGDGWAFRHVLLRDHLYDVLAPSRRAQLHQRAGELLEPGSARAAHHLLLGTDRPRAIAAARAAATRATAVFAFEDAVALLEAALRAGDTVEARIELAEARHRVGQGDLARAECVRAAELARPSRDAEVLGRIALVYGVEVMTGRRDAQMIALLEEALALLPSGDSQMRARLMARLAAARVPNPEGEQVSLEMSREAIAMARRLGDPEAELYALRFAGHSQGFRTAAREHLPLVLDVIAHAKRVGRPLEVLEQHTWLVGAYLALGDRHASDAAIAEVEALLARVPQPHYRWRMPLLRANRAILRGDFVDAQRWMTVTRDLAHEHELSRARMSWAWTAVSIAAASRDVALAESVIDELGAIAHIIGNVSRGCLAYALAIAGRHVEARAELVDAALPTGVVLAQFAAEAILMLDDRARMERALEALLPVLDLYPIGLGPAGSLLLRPIALVIGELQLALGRRTEAIALFEQGLALARAIEAVPFVRDAEALLARVGRVTGPRDHALAIACSDDVARVSWRGREIVAPAGKGFEYLAMLVAAPGREVHVSDLVGDDDRGDAGEVLDARARAEYRERAQELQSELDDARARNDLGRAEALAAELEAVTDQLLAGTGLGGRARRAGSHVERARVNVQRRLKDAIRRLAGEDAELGRYLEATIRTGVFCVYRPV